jgi:hypothetical protein
VLEVRASAFNLSSLPYGSAKSPAEAGALKDGFEPQYAVGHVGHRIDSPDTDSAPVSHDRDWRAVCKAGWCVDGPAWLFLAQQRS